MSFSVLTFKKKVDMDPQVVKQVMLSPLFLAFSVLIRTLVSALCICGGAKLFDFRHPSSIIASPFTKQRVFGLFLLITGVRLLVSVITHTTPFD